MKYAVIGCAILSLLFVGSPSAHAQKMMAGNVGFELAIPIGEFGDVVNIGFGGTGQFEYNIDKMLTVTGKIGYITWGAKDVSEEARQAGVDASLDYKGLPFLVGGKYFFMPAGNVRAYGQFELGLFFASVSSKVTVPGFGTQEGSVSETSFTIAPAVGVEIPAGQSGAVDVSARYWGIFKDGSAHNIGFRAGYKFMF